MGSGRPVSVLTACLGSSVCLWIPEDLYEEVWAFRTAAFSFWRSETSRAAISSGVGCSRLKREGVENRWKQRQLCRYPRGKEFCNMGEIKESYGAFGIGERWRLQHVAAEMNRCKSDKSLRKTFMLYSTFWFFALNPSFFALLSFSSEFNISTEYTQERHLV